MQPATVSCFMRFCKRVQSGSWQYYHLLKNLRCYFEHIFGRKQISRIPIQTLPAVQFSDGVGSGFSAY